MVTTAVIVGVARTLGGALIDGRPRASLMAAGALITMGNAARAAAVIEPVLGSPALAASGCVLMCNAAIGDGRWSDCVTWADRAREHGDTSYHVLALKALGLHFSGRSDEALAIVLDVAERRPLIRLAWVVQSLVYLLRDNLTAAEGSVAHVLDLSPALDATAWALRGRLAEARSRYDEAGRSVVEARAGAARAVAVDRRVASAVLSDGAWADRALERSREIGDLISRALRHARARPSTGARWNSSPTPLRSTRRPRTLRTASGCWPGSWADRVGPPMSPGCTCRDATWSAFAGPY